MKKYKIDKRVKCFNDWVKYYLPQYYKKQQEEKKEQEIRNKLDDICIKHHGNLPYEPF